uniref:Uncharacterized protein n=1 Tax=Physcomitrium patens TaxID=3218 RepID=A0A2K1J9U7_PHYPA|nr:hypothetical protein PHYPA_021398 [Physcomitrium patens]
MQDLLGCLGGGYHDQVALPHLEHEHIAILLGHLGQVPMVQVISNLTIKPKPPQIMTAGTSKSSISRLPAAVYDSEEGAQHLKCIRESFCTNGKSLELFRLRAPHPSTLTQMHQI